MERTYEGSFSGGWKAQILFSHVIAILQREQHISRNRPISSRHAPFGKQRPIDYDERLSGGSCSLWKCLNMHPQVQGDIINFHKILLFFATCANCDSLVRARGMMSVLKVHLLQSATRRTDWSHCGPLLDMWLYATRSPLSVLHF